MSLENVTCIECRGHFWREKSEDWKIRCFPCWRRSKESTKPDDLGDHLRELLQLCHPDRHRGSALAHRVTQWLLTKRNALGRS